ncbi:Rv0909 family putative TA system antitoxin [Micrococcus sp. 2A]|uniref:antitoxin n=1 Tax=Micrococcus TaxID=1269 RepID=UPI0026360E0D|nr:antitoxin [Micrococcus sp. M4NT]MDX2341580.1 antitoxin [Micrococcus sp. M4NT]
MDMNKIGDLANQHSDKVNSAVDGAQEQHADKLGEHAGLVNKGVDGAQEKFLNDSEEQSGGTPA